MTTAPPRASFAQLGLALEIVELLQPHLRPEKVETMGLYRPLFVEAKGVCKHSPKDIERAFECAQEVATTGTTNADKLYATWSVFARVDLPDTPLCKVAYELTYLSYVAAFEWAYDPTYLDRIIHAAEEAKIDCEPLVIRWHMAEALKVTITGLDRTTVQAAYALYTKAQSTEDRDEMRRYFDSAKDILTNPPEPERQQKAV